MMSHFGVLFDMASESSENTNAGDRDGDLSLRNEDEKDTDWKCRALELEEQLSLLRERVNSQTIKIREAVAKRVAIAEDNAKQAEEKVESLLMKIQVLEERCHIAENKVARSFERNQHLEDIIEQKESIIRQLRMSRIEQNNNDIDARIFDEKLAMIKELVQQCKETNQDLLLQIQEKDEIIQRLKNGYSHHNTVRTSRFSSASDGEESSPKMLRARSNSAVSRNVAYVSEIVPAVPPRRASLGILNRSGSFLRTSGKGNLHALKESSKSKNSSETNTSTQNEGKSGVCDEFSENEENTENERTYMVLEPEPDVVYAVPNKSKYFTSAEKDKEEPEVRMTMRERLKQLTQSSEEEVDHNSENDLSPVDERKSLLVNELINSLEIATRDTSEAACANGGLQQVVTVKFNADGAMLSADGATVTVDSGSPVEVSGNSVGGSGSLIGDNGKGSTAENCAGGKPTSNARFHVKPGTDTLGYTKLLHFDERKDNGRKKAAEKEKSKSPRSGSFVSYLPRDSPDDDLDCDSSEANTLNHSSFARGSWAQNHKVLNPVVNGIIASEDWKQGSDVDVINGTSDGFACNLGQVQSCPVYAQLEGRASEIQSRPCTGESTDSSDNETEPSYSHDGESAAGANRVKGVSVGDRLLRRGSAKRKVLKTCAQYTTHNLKSESLQKAGHLSKLGGRIKNWKRRWFVLSENKLSYYKTESDVNKKALGQIPLDGFCGITRIQGSLSFQIDTAKRKYYLTGDTVEDVDEWLKVLQNVLKKFLSSPLLAQVNEKAVMKGWVTKVKLGKSKRCYCILRGKYLCYYKGEKDQAPFGLLNVKEMHIEKIVNADSEDELGINNDEQRTGRFTLRLYDEKQPTTSSVYLVIDTKQDLNAWLYHLTMASGRTSQLGTEFEQTVAKLEEVDGDPESQLWNNSLMTHSKEPLEKPLTTLPSEELEDEALQLFKSIQLFCDTECVPGRAIDYHVVNVQNALQKCIAHVELREEIFCQLVKQTAKRVHVLSESASALERFLAPHSEWLMASRTCSVSSDATIDLRPVREYVYEQCWQLLVLCCSLFVPRGQILWFLKAHLSRHSSRETIIGKYAKYCQRCLERTIQNGEREAGPARMEVLAVLLDDPFDRKYPLKIPVHFVNRTSEEFGFDGATTVQELIDAINSEIGIRSVEQSGYALYTDNPVGNVRHCLQTSVKVCDVISKWEKAMQSSQQGRLETNRVIRLSYKNRLYFRSLSKSETPTERYFLVYQTFYDIVNGRFPIAKDRCTRLAALMAQMEFGDRVAHGNQSEEKISMIQERFYPRKMKEPMTSEQRRHLRNGFLDAWQSLMGKTKQECITLYLCIARNWATFGAKLFKAKQRRIVTKKRDSTTETLEDVWLAVEEECISILDIAKMNPVFKYRYRTVVTFGGWKEDFMLVVNKATQKGSGQSELGTERLLFVMSRGKILEITLLIASYINAIVRQQGLTFDVRYPTKKTTGASEKNIKVWDMESAEWPMLPGAGLI